MSHATYRPPGCGKTARVVALARESGLPLIYIPLAERDSVDLGYKLTSGASVLRTALRKNLQGAAERLLSKGAHCGNEIEEAMFSGNWSLVKFLVRNGFECDPNRCLPMSVECVEILEFLINKGVNSDALQVALERAVTLNITESAELLLKHGARPTPDLVPHLAKMNVGIFSL